MASNVLEVHRSIRSFGGEVLLKPGSEIALHNSIFNRFMRMQLGEMMRMCFLEIAQGPMQTQLQKPLRHGDANKMDSSDVNPDCNRMRQV